jgi:hypothetical protein
MTDTDFSHLLSSIRALTPAQMRKLRHQIDNELAPPARTPAKAAKRSRPAPSQPAKKPMTREEFNQHLLSIGLISSLPDPALDIDDDDPDDQPIAIEGEPLSETIIRERR